MTRRLLEDMAEAEAEDALRRTHEGIALVAEAKHWREARLDVERELERERAEPSMDTKDRQRTLRELIDHYCDKVDAAEHALSVAARRMAGLA